MPNDSLLPRPNIPQPGQGDATNTAATSATVAAAASTPTQAQPQGQPSGTPTNQPSSVGSSAPKTPSPPSLPKTTVSGLDTQNPGGAPPTLNEKGQVVNTSTISQTQHAPSYDQPQAPPESTLQKVQAAGPSAPGQVGQRTELGGAGSSIGAASQGGTNQDQDQQAAQVAPVAKQQTIQAAAQTQPQQQAADLRQTPSTHPNLGLNVPGVSGGPGSAGSGLTTKGKVNSSTNASTKQNKKAKKAAKNSVPGDPTVAKPKKPIMKYLLFGLGALAIVGGVVFGITQILGGDEPVGTSRSPEAPTTDSPSTQTPQDELLIADSDVVLSYWGLWEPESVMQEVFDDFEDQTGISVDYRQQSHRDYRTRLQSAISQGTGPDVFRYHATWVSMLKDDLAPLPSRVMSVAEYEQTFYPIYSQQLQHNGQLVGIPLMYDGLGLYYNKDILETANEEVPSTWGEVRVLAEKLTVRSGAQVERGGIALGNTTNVEHFSDVLGLLIFQNGGDPTNPVTGQVRDAIDFYSIFGRNDPIYGTNLPSSSVAFARGEVAMMIAPSWRVHEVLHINPELNFDIAPVPKLGESEQSWATYWAEGVNSQSQHQDEAWQLLKYLSSPEVLRKLYSAQSEIRAFGEIYPRVEMASELAGQPYVATFLEDAPSAVSAPMCSYTHDSGLNDTIIDYYKDALNSASQRSLDDTQLQTLSRGVNQALGQFQ